MNARTWTTIFEWLGSALGIFYALLIASNTGNEIIAFAMLLTSATLFAGWAVIDKRWAFLAHCKCFMQALLSLALFDGVKEAFIL